MKKVLFGLAITAALLVMVTGYVFAQEDTPPIKGMVQSVVLETDPETSVITAVVTLVDELGETQVVRISLDTAVELGLVDLEQAVVEIPEGGIEVTIEAIDIITEDIDDGTQHPVATALSDFFSTLLGVDYDVIMAAHEGDEEGSGVGFGVIAQALWMTKSLEGNTDMFQLILDAKTNGTYSDVTLPDGSMLTLPDGSPPTNWGQFRKAVQSLSDEEKEKHNLGSIMSDHADDETTTDLDSESTRPDKGNKDKDKDKDKGKGKGKDD